MIKLTIEYKTEDRAIAAMDLFVENNTDRIREGNTIILMIADLSWAGYLMNAALNSKGITVNSVKMEFNV